MDISRREFLRLSSAAALSALPVVSACNDVVNPVRARTRKNFTNIPTIELHRHFEAGLSPETIAKFAQRNNVTHVLTRNSKQPITGIDPQNPDSIRHYYQKIASGFSDSDGFAKFLDSLGVPVSVMRRPEDLEEAAYQQIVDQAHEGSLHTELRGSPYTYNENLIQPVSLQEIIQAIYKGIKRAFEEHKFSGSFTACVSRNKVDQFGAQVADAVLKIHTSDDPVGIDLAGAPENKFPPAAFERLFRPLAEAGIPITIHAGEQAKPPSFADAPPSFILDAVRKLGARRIGHATSLMSDRSAMSLIRERGVCLECCPIANQKLGYMLLENHPLKRFLEEGLIATLNTDDPLMFGRQSVREILVEDHEALELTVSNALQLTRNAISAAFVSPEKRKFLEQLFESNSS